MIDDGADYSHPRTVQRIAASPSGERGGRNYEITRSYFAIGQKLRERLGDENADWATTAAWASGAVGLIVREEETDTSRLMRLARRVGGVHYDAVLSETRSNLEEGNRQVYAELGLAFAELAHLINGRRPTERAERDFLDNLPVTRRSVPVEWQDETPLRPAFELYLRALRLDGRTAESAKRKAELIFAANVLVTVSEQAGLQPYLDASFSRISRFVQDNPFGRLPWVRGGVQVVAYAVQALGQRLVTEFTIKVPVGKEALQVGDRLRPRNGRMWPTALAELREPEAIRAWETYAWRVRDDGGRSSAADWTVMADRMAYITAFFRAWQQEPALRDIPEFLVGKHDRHLS